MTEGRVTAVGESNDRTFVELYRSTNKQVLKYALSKCGNIDDASDITQKTYLNYYERIKKHGDVEGNILSYLIKIADSELRKYYITNSKKSNDIPAFSEFMDDEEFDAFETLLVQEVPEYTKLDTEEIWQYIKTLDPLTFNIFILYFHHDEKLADIAKTLSTSESTVKNRLYRTIEKLKEKFNFS